MLSLVKMIQLMMFTFSILTFISCNSTQEKSKAVAINTVELYNFTTLIGLTNSSTRSVDMVVDGKGNKYAIGHTMGNLDGESLTGPRDLFISKLDKDGNKVWTRLSGSAGLHSQGIAIDTDELGNIYLVGLQMDAFLAQIDIFIMKFNSAGLEQWKQVVANNFTGNMTDLSTDAYGNFYIVGNTSSSLNGETRTGFSDSFLSKYNANGNHQWTKLIGSNTPLQSITSGQGVTIHKDDEIYITGNTTGALDGQSKIGNIDAYVTKFDSAGQKQWTRQLGNLNSTTKGEGAAVDSNGNVFLTGSTNGNLDGQTKTGISDFFLTKYDQSGTKLWTKLIGEPNVGLDSYKIVSDSVGDLYIAGMMGTGNDYDIFVTKMSNSGDREWIKSLEGNSHYEVGITLDSNDKIFVTGSIDGSLDGKVASGAPDGFVTSKFNFD